MLNFVSTLFFGEDSWFIGAGRSEFENAIFCNKVDKVSRMLSRGVRDKHIIAGMIYAIDWKRSDMFKLLLSKRQVIRCIKKYSNLRNYEYDTSNYGIIGNAGCAFFSLIPQSSDSEKDYDNLLMYAIFRHTSAVKKSEQDRKKSLCIICEILFEKNISILLKLHRKPEIEIPLSG